jgi:hypothetical protein
MPGTGWAACARTVPPSGAGLGSTIRGYRLRHAPVAPELPAAAPTVDDRPLRGRRPQILECLLAAVGEDDGAPELHDLFAAAELVDEERVELLDVTDADVEQEVITACQDEHCHHLWHGQGVVVEAFDEVSAEWSYLGEDERLDRPAEGGEVNLGVEAGDHASGLEAPDSFGACRCGHADDLCEVTQREPGVSLKFSNYLAVDSIK